ncbi:hypothetical protein CGLO_13695 [Colletotrichum gloeosporioides Cg-14]|uniref:Uncharacterized protein n=1 Tax=Colletotrichum gloeosporioides (strain Cg-14) TaxID=1237896 RepID=T0L6K4_COLGC|nr:hypothetical protein CGLO_13695 [Colletotrichum gloeosporioides Cg-14]
MLDQKTIVAAGERLLIGN